MYICVYLVGPLKDEITEAKRIRALSHALQNFDPLSRASFALKGNRIDQPGLGQCPQNAIALPMVHELRAPGEVAL